MKRGKENERGRQIEKQEKGKGNTDLRDQRTTQIERQELERYRMTEKKNSKLSVKMNKGKNTPMIVSA